MADGVKRPGGVTIVAVLAGIAGALDVISGVILLFEANNDDVAARFGGTGGLMSAAIGSIIVGAIVLVLSVGLWRGNQAARMIVTVLQVLSLIGSLFLAVAYLGNPVGEWIGVAVSAALLILLWTRSASAYFQRSESIAR